MSKMLKILVLFLSVATFLCGCVNSEVQNDTESRDTETFAETEIETKNETETETEALKLAYTVIYPEGCEKFIKNLAVTVSDEINKNTENKLIYKSDKDAATKYEILIGNTNRAASALNFECVGNDGWWVDTTEDTIVINGVSRKGMLAAVQHFLANYTVDSNGDVRFPEEACVTKEIFNEKYEQGLTLRVGTYNIKHGEQVGLDMSVLANDIKALNLDVVGLQEVDVGTSRSAGIDEVKEIAEGAGYEYYYFCKAIDYQGGGYGTAILSRYPIKSFENIPLFTEPGMEGRAVGHAVLDVNGIEVDYYNTHLSYEKTSVTQKQFEQIAELTKDKEYFIITADFNTEYSKLFDIVENSVRVNHGKFVTFPDGWSAIDDIIVEQGWGINDSNCVIGHSDHRIFWAELRYDGGIR